MNHIRQHPFISAMLINIVLFSIVSASGFPIFNSGDDVFLLYLSGGGFGEPPTELLHYQYGMHPFVSLILKTLFTHFPNFNWYTALLYLFHFLTCIIILWQWIKRNTLVFALAGYVLCFVTIELRFLLQPSFTNTALVTTISGLLLLYDGFMSQNKTKARLIAGCILILIATLLRLHMIVPAIIVALPFLIGVIKRNRLASVLSYTISLSIVIGAFIFLQHQYYTKHIPGWEDEELYRQTVIHHYNTPKKIDYTAPERVRINTDFLQNGILWDKQFLSRNQIDSTTASVKLTTSLQQNDFKERVYWLMLESRILLVFMLLIFLWKFPSLNIVDRRAVISSAILLFAMVIGLLLFRKLPPYIIPGSVLAWLAFMGQTGEKYRQDSTTRSWVFGICATLLFGWSAFQSFKLNRWNKQQHSKWQCAYKEVAAFPDKLFVVTDDKFPADYFHIWDVPKQYPLTNVLYKDHFLNNLWQQQYERLGISSALHFLNNNKIVFTGAPMESIRRYYELQTGKRVDLVSWQMNTNCISAWQISVK